MVLQSTNEAQGKVDENLSILSDDFIAPLLIPLMGGVLSGGAAAGTKIAIGNSGAKWSAGERPPDAVSFYKDHQFQGGRRDFPSYQYHAQNSLSKGILGTGLSKENDTYTSAIIPAGVTVVIYENNDKGGRKAYLYGPGRYSNLGRFWNDRISSFEIIPEARGCSIPVVGDPDNVLKPDPAYQFSTRVGPPWKCPDGWIDTGCTWGHTGREQLQCAKRR